HHPADRPPQPVERTTVVQQCGQRAGVRQVTGDEVRLVREPAAHHAAGDGPRRRQPELGEPREQTPLAERAGALEPGPHIVVLDEAGDDAAAMVVPDHPTLVAAVDDPHSAAARPLVEGAGLALDVSAVEEAKDLLLGERGVMHDDRVTGPY